MGKKNPQRAGRLQVGHTAGCQTVVLEAFHDTARGLRNDRNLATDWHEVTSVTVGYSVWGVLPWLDMRAVKTVDSGARTRTVPAVGEAERLQLLMHRYQQADRVAVTELVRILSPKLIRYLAGPLYTRAYAEDMLQECWLRIHRARHTHRPGTPVLPWIFAIARHTRIDAFRRRRRIQSRESAVEEFGELPAPAPDAPRIPDLDLWRLVRKLPPSQQEVIEMLKVSGMSLEEVAYATGSTIGAVKQKAHRAYTKLRAMLQSSPAPEAKT